MHKTFLNDLARAVGPGGLLQDPADLLTYESDGLPHLRATPVLFCSGLSGAQMQAEELGETQVSFLSKPYTLHGMGLKVLGMILAARLG